MAYYAPGIDVIQLPVSEAFRDAESYAATKKSSSPSWARPPCARTSASPLSRARTTPPNLAHWLEILREDKRAIFSAAAHAQRAA